MNTVITVISYGVLLIATKLRMFRLFISNQLCEESRIVTAEHVVYIRY